LTAHRYRAILGWYWRLPMNIRDNSTLNRVEVDMLSRTIHLHGDDGEYLKLHEPDAQDFTNMCAFINDSLTEDMITYTY
jgi:hypothetical protein